MLKQIDYKFIKGSRKLGILTVESENTYLHQRSTDVSLSELDKPYFRSILKSLMYTASEALTPEGYRCVGLSAIQVGIPLRIFVMMDVKTEKFSTYINPSIEPLSDESESKPETCMSIPGLKAQKNRYLHIKLTYTDSQGSRQCQELHKFQARIAQHEMDHLDGILMTD